MAKASKAKKKGSSSPKNAEINKELIRRLRIQNKKLIEQVMKLKEQLKQSKFLVVGRLANNVK